LRGIHVDSDYNTYTGYFKAVRNSSFSEALIIVEPSFVVLSWILPNIRAVVLIYAALSVLIKIKALERIAPFPFFSIAMLFSHFFLVHEMNQIRAGIAIGGLLLSIPFIVERNIWKFTLIILFASLFHYSAIVFFPVYFLNYKKLNRIYFFLIPGAYAFYMLGMGLMEILSLIKINFLQSKIEAYNSLYSAGFYTKMNVFNPIIVLRIALIYLFLYNWERLYTKSVYFFLLLKIYVISITLMVLFASLPAFGLRIADIFGIVEIILLPYVFYLLDKKYIMLAALFMFGLILMSLDLLYNHFLQAYTI
jgi:hypothetical protein